jgi:hypothetical protein
MKRAILLLGLFLSTTSWAEDVYWSNGEVWRGVTIGDVTWTSKGMSVLCINAPGYIRQQGSKSYGGAMKIIKPKAAASAPIVPIAVQNAKAIADGPRRTPRSTEKPAETSPKIEAEFRVTPRDGRSNPARFELVGTITNTTEQRIYGMEVEFTVYQGNRAIAHTTYSVFALVPGKTEFFRIPIGFGGQRTSRDVPCEVRSKITSITFR